MFWLSLVSSEVKKVVLGIKEVGSSVRLFVVIKLVIVDVCG